MNFNFIELDIPEVLLVIPDKFYDARGSFSEIFREDIFNERGIGPFVQENLSSSRDKVIRGLHYQEAPMELGKLVSCVSGTIKDVAVDIRPDSPTFGKWTSCNLHNGHMLWVPQGFAHGFEVLTGEAIVLYRQTQYYSSEHDKAIVWNDPDINIEWVNKYPVISDKDKNAPSLREVFPDKFE